jgi:nitrogen fixation protein FixH
VALALTLTDAEGRPIEGAAVTAGAWMPVHGHGAAATVTDVGDGEYAIDTVLPMPGRWEIRVEARAGDVADAFTFPVDVE